MRDTLRWLAPAAFGAACVAGGSFLPDGHEWATGILVVAGVLFVVTGLDRATNGAGRA